MLSIFRAKWLWYTTAMKMYPPLFSSVATSHPLVLQVSSDEWCH